jgi:hypothetical protein
VAPVAPYADMKRSVILALCACIYSACVQSAASTDTAPEAIKDRCTAMVLGKKVGFC